MSQHVEYVTGGLRVALAFLVVLTPLLPAPALTFVEVPVAAACCCGEEADGCGCAAEADCCTGASCAPCRTFAGGATYLPASDLRLPTPPAQLRGQGAEPAPLEAPATPPLPPPQTTILL